MSGARAGHGGQAARPGSVRWSARAAAGAVLASAGLHLPLDAQPVPEEITVTVTRRVGATAWPAPEAPAAVSVLSRADLRDGQPLVSLSESLVRVPGVTANNRQNPAQDLQISVRGFGARASFGIRGIRLLIDELPATFPDGQAQGAVVPLSTLSRIEVLRGPWAVAYGNAAGGVIHAFSAPAGASPGTRVETLGGAYGQTRLGLAGEWSADGSGRALSGVRGEWVGYRATGWRQHSRTERHQWTARADFVPAAGQQLALHAQWLDQPVAQDPLGLTAAQLAEDPRQAGTGAVSFNTRKSVRQQQAGLVWQGVAQGWDWTAVLHGGQRDIRQFLAIPVAAQAAAASGGGVVDLARGFSGVALRAGAETSVWSWQAGMEWSRSDEARKGFENFDAAGHLGVLGRLRRDESTAVSGRDVFLQAGLSPSAAAGQSLRWLAGVRHARVRLSTRDHYLAPGNGDDSGQIEYAAGTGSVGVSWTARPGVHWHASLGRGFETPTSAELAYRADGGSGFNGSLRSSTSRQAEAGLKLRHGDGLRLDATLFHIDSANEIVPASNSGGRTTFQNGGRTLRRGAELGLRVPLARGLVLDASASWIDARFREGYRSTSGSGSAQVGRSVAAGNGLPGLPARSLFASIGRPLAGPGSGWALDWIHRGPMWADDRNTARAPAAHTLSARWMHRLRWQGGELDSYLRLDNLTNRRHVGSVIVNEANERFFESAPGRAVTIGLTLRFR